MFDSASRMDSGVRRVRRPTISVVCPTAHPGQVIAAALGDLREVVDEVVVAADARVGADDLGHYAQVADTLLRFEFAGSNRHWPWLAEQARGDWLLIHDGDELVSSALLDALGDLVSDRRIHQYSLPIHWPWPDSTRRLVGEPWDSGHGLRLVRNDGRLAFYAAKHAIAVADNPIRHMDELPVYHLDLLFADRTSREAKVARYDAELFGLMTAEGLPVNAAYYVPESAEEPPATIHIPREDSDRIEHAIRALGSVPAVDPKAIALHDREQIQWYAPRAVLQPEDYRGTIELARALPVFVAQYDQHPVWVRVTNGGNARWPGGEGREPNIRVGAYWRALDGSARQEAGRALLTHVLDPGEDRARPCRLSCASTCRTVRARDRPCPRACPVVRLRAHRPSRRPAFGGRAARFSGCALRAAQSRWRPSYKCGAPSRAPTGFCDTSQPTVGLPNFRARLIQKHRDGNSFALRPLSRERDTCSSMN